MIYLYLTKQFGVFPKGSIERFAPRKAEELIKEGIAERYEPAKHSKKPTAPRLGRRKVTKG